MLHIKKIYWVAAAVLFFLVLFSGCSDKAVMEDIKINKEASWLSDFDIQGSEVSFYCRLSISNDSEEKCAVQILGEFDEDFKGGLIEESKIEAHSTTDKEETIFYLSPGENTIDVVFTGQFAGNPQKHDRNLPEITIISVD